MRSAVDQALFGFLKRHIDAEAPAKKQAVESAQNLRERLAAKCEEDKTLPLPHTDGFPFGSLERGTKEDPVDDSDYMYVMNAGGLYGQSGGATVGPCAGSPISNNPLMLDRYKDEYGNVSSAKVLAAFRETLGGLYPRSEVRKDGQAVNVWLESYGFGIDLVPAVLILPQNGMPPHYYIPLGKGQSGWLATNPKVDLGAYEKEDLRSGGILRPAARLARTWNTYSNAGRLNGFLVDVLVLHASSTWNTGGSLSLLMARVFADATERLKAPIPQLTGFEPSIDAGLSDEDRASSITALTAAARTANAAIVAETSGDTASALKQWAVLLGDELLQKVAA